MIRILHVVTYMGLGGLETMIMNYYRHIDRTKFQFDFLVHRDFEAVYDKEIKSLGGRIFTLPKLVPWSKKYRKALRTFLLEHPEYKIIHVHQDCLSSVILKEAEKCGIPHRIAHAHSSSQNKDLKYPIKLFYKRKIAKYATHLLACSKKAGEWMFGTPNFEIMNNAIDAKSFIFSQEVRENKRKELGISGDCFVLGNTGRLSEPKNHSFLLDIFYRFNQLNPNSKLLLIGDGHLREKIEAKITNLGLTDSVILAGARNDVNELLQTLDVFIMTSLYEGLAIASIEAQAAGIPCVISDNISKECEITNLIKWRSLTDNVDVWCKTISSVANTPRQNTQSDIQAAGYDIATNAVWLQNYYTNLTKE